MSQPVSSSDRVRQAAVVVALIATIVVNVLSNALPIAGRTAKDVSDRFQSPFTPAGFTFAIWGVIYLALITYAVYQALPRNAANPRLRETGWLFVLSCAANITWLFAWHNLLLGLSVAIMLVLLLSLIAIHGRLGYGNGAPTEESLLVRVPFSIYLGWITVATVANVTALLVSLGANDLFGIPGEAWAVIVTFVAAGLGLAFTRLFGDIPYNLVLLWAFYGIISAQPNTNLTTYGVAAAGIVVVAGMVLLRPRFTGFPGGAAA